MAEPSKTKSMIVTILILIIFILLVFSGYFLIQKQNREYADKINASKTTTKNISNETGSLCTKTFSSQDQTLFTIEIVNQTLLLKDKNMQTIYNRDIEIISAETTLCDNLSPKVRVLSSKENEYKYYIFETDQRSNPNYNYLVFYEFNNEYKPIINLNTITDTKYTNNDNKFIEDVNSITYLDNLCHDIKYDFTVPYGKTAKVKLNLSKGIPSYTLLETLDIERTKNC